jgi:predicted RND superfamily exporter protein
MVLGCWILAVLGVAPLVAGLRIETTTGSVLDRTGPEWAFYQEAQDVFGGDEILTVLLESDEAFGAHALEKVVELSEKFESIEGVRRVDSIATVPVVRSAADGTVLLEPGIDQVDGFSLGAREELARLLRDDRIAPRTLFTADEKAFAVNIILEKGAEAYYDIVLRSIDDAIGGETAWVSGVPVFRQQADARTRRELAFFVPATALFVAALLFVVFGDLRAVVIPLAASGMGVWIMVGVMAASDVPITIATVLLPSILLALGCAYAMHVLAVAPGITDQEELIDKLGPVALPLALSGLTTAVGFLAISTVRIDAIRDVGSFGALGVLVVLAATLTAAPAALALFPLPGREPRFRGWLTTQGADRVVAHVGGHPFRLAVIWLLLVGAAVVGALQVKVETDVIRWFPAKDPVRVSYDEIRERLSGISPINIIVRGDDGQSLTDPRVMKAIDRLATDLERLPAVGRVVSVADPLRQLHGGFTDDAARPLPESQPMIAQYLLLLDSKEYSRNLITADRSAANILLRVDDNGSEALLRVADSARAFWGEYGVEGFSARPTGIMYEFARAEDAIAWGQLVGLSLAFAAVGLILLLMFGSPMIALAALVPNAVPILMAFGAMGWLRIPLDAGTVILGSLALGVAVDDTVHLTEAFVNAREQGAPRADSLRQALVRVLPPITYTTAVVAVGFLVLGFSGFTLTRNLGLLTSAVMLLCLIADLSLLPLLLTRGGTAERKKAT